MRKILCIMPRLSRRAACVSRSPSLSEHWRVSVCLSGHLFVCRSTRPTTSSFVRLANYMCVTQSGSVQPATATAIIVIGGYGDSGYLSSGERFDPAANAWSPIASMGTARAYHAAAVIDGLLYAIGGTDGSYLSSGERFDPAANAWSPITSMGTARYGPAAAAL